MFISGALIALTKGCRRMLCIRCLGDILQNGLILFRALLFSWILGAILSQNGCFTGIQISYLAVLAGTILAEGSLICLNQYTGTLLGADIKNRIRKEIIDNILRAGPAYVQKQRSGNLVAALIGKTESMEPYYTAYLPNAVSALFWMGTVIFYFLTISRWIAFASLFGILIVLLVPNFWNQVMFARGEEDWELFTEFQAEMMDDLQGMGTLKAFNTGRQRGRRLEELAWRIHHTTMKNLSVSQIESGILIFGAAIGSSLSVGVAVWQKMIGAITGAELITVMFLAGACFTPVFTLIDTWHLGYHGLTAAPTVFSLLREAEKQNAEFLQETEKRDALLKDHGKDRTDFKSGIYFEQICFGYEKNEKVLNDLSFMIPKGKKTALVGESGSGKSTILNLLAGFYLPWSGRILADGQEICYEKLRGRMGVVWQEPYLFYGTVYDNICIGAEKTDMESVEQAARMAHIHEFIKTLPQGYQTMVGERGMRLSGGEKQRIAIARCFLRQPQLLIFDEATSGLDRENEEKIKKSERNLLKGRTALIVAHRLSTIQNADWIYVLQNGRIVQSGTHHTMINREGIYRSLMKRQSEE